MAMSHGRSVVKKNFKKLGDELATEVGCLPLKKNRKKLFNLGDELAMENGRRHFLEIL